MDNKTKVSELLALRDGEPYDSRIVENEEQIEHMQTLKQLAGLKSDLNELPNIQVDDSVWMPAKDNRSSKSVDWRRYPFATAASVFVVSAMAIFAVFGGGDVAVNNSTFAVRTQIDPTAIRTAALMAQSRNLEQAFTGGFSPQPLTASRQTNAVATLAYRVADVDDQIARLYENETVDAQLRRQLWQKRVELLEAYLGELATAYPDLLGNSRSM